MREVVRLGCFRVAMQPIVSLLTGNPIGYEAFVRAPPPYDRPDRLLKAAMRDGCLRELEAAITKRAVEEALCLFGVGSLKLFVNLTATTFCAGSEQCEEALKDFPADRVVIELTESAALPHDGQVQDAALKWRALGCRLAVDDVAAGYARLLAVGLLSPDYLKIDREVVGGMGDRAWRGVVKSMVTLAGEIGARVIAEGIETREQREALVDLGVEYGQGYLLGRPVVCPDRRSDEGARVARMA